MITDIYRIKTMNSVYEIHIADPEPARCRKEGGEWKTIKVTPTDAKELMETLFIGASFKVPGVVTTSVVQDYQHYQPVDEVKQFASTIGGFFRDVADHVIEQANGGAVMIAPPQERTCEVEGCDYHPVPGGPNIHRVNPHCKSGGRPHCTCDYCF